LHFLSVALLVSVYFRRDNALLKWSVSRLMIKIGQHSLEIFSLSVVFDVLLNIVVLTGAPSLSERILMDGIAFLLLALSAIALAYRRETVLKRRI
jgi:OpgC protein